MNNLQFKETMTETLRSTGRMYYFEPFVAGAFGIAGSVVAGPVGAAAALVPPVLNIAKMALSNYCAERGWCEEPLGFFAVELAVTGALIAITCLALSILMPLTVSTIALATFGIGLPLIAETVFSEYIALVSMEQEAEKEESQGSWNNVKNDFSCSKADAERKGYDPKQIPEERTFTDGGLEVKGVSYDGKFYSHFPDIYSKNVIPLKFIALKSFTHCGAMRAAWLDYSKNNPGVHYDPKTNAWYCKGAHYLTKEDAERKGYDPKKMPEEMKFTVLGIEVKGVSYNGKFYTRFLPIFPEVEIPLELTSIHCDEMHAAWLDYSKNNPGAHKCTETGLWYREGRFFYVEVDAQKGCFDPTRKPERYDFSAVTRWVMGIHHGRYHYNGKLFPSQSKADKALAEHFEGGVERFAEGVDIARGVV